MKELILKMNDKKYKQGERIYFDMGNGVSGFATICGCASDPIPPLGRQWIIQIEPGVLNAEIYPYSHIVIFEIMIKPAPENLLVTGQS